MLDRVKGPKGLVALAKMEKEEVGMIYKELLDDACKHIYGNMTL